MKANYQTMTHAQMAAALGRLVGSVKSFCGNNRLFVCRRWSQEELAFVRARLAAGDSCVQISRELKSRTLNGIRRLREMWGYDTAGQKKRKLTGLNELITARYAQQFSDSEIAQEWNQLHPDATIDRTCISYRRSRLGLSARHTQSERYRNRVREKTMEQVKLAGVDSLGELRAVTLKNRIVEMGWPEDLQYREAQILSLIWDRGPLTKREICEALKMPFRGAREHAQWKPTRGHLHGHADAPWNAHQIHKGGQNRSSQSERRYLLIAVQHRTEKGQLGCWHETTTRTRSSLNRNGAWKSTT